MGSENRQSPEPVTGLTEYKCYYNVEMAAGEDGCAHCGAGKMWAIVYVEHGQTEKTEIGQTFGDRELADDICDLMNMAYEAGLEVGAPSPNDRMPIPVTEIVDALERESANADTDPRWLAAAELRRMTGWEMRTLMCSVDESPPVTMAAVDGRCEVGK
jgi:hypothetical protein